MVSSKDMYSFINSITIIDTVSNMTLTSNVWNKV